MSTISTVTLTGKSSLIAPLLPLFEEGVEIEITVGCSVKQLLTEQLGIEATYLAERITTLFLNHKAVDDAENAIVDAGATLALSGAMPGLVGATMRSGGFYSAFRTAMTYRNTDGKHAAGRGIIHIKLFNLVLSELVPDLLRYGVILQADRLSRSVEQFSDQFQGRFDGQLLEKVDLIAALQKADIVRLAVEIDDEIKHQEPSSTDDFVVKQLPGNGYCGAY